MNLSRTLGTLRELERLAAVAPDQKFVSLELCAQSVGTLVASRVTLEFLRTRLNSFSFNCACTWKELIPAVIAKTLENLVLDEMTEAMRFHYVQLYRAYLLDTQLPLRQLWFLSSEQEKASFFHCQTTKELKLDQSFMNFLQPGDNLAFLYQGLENNSIVCISAYERLVMNRSDASFVEIYNHLFPDGFFNSAFLLGKVEEYNANYGMIIDPRSRSLGTLERVQTVILCAGFAGCLGKVLEALLMHYPAPKLGKRQRRLAKFDHLT